MQAEHSYQGNRDRGNKASPERHEYDDDQIKKGDRPGLEVKQTAAKVINARPMMPNKNCVAACRNPWACFWHGRPIRRPMSIVNPAHPSVPVFLRKMTVEFQNVPVMDSSGAMDISMPHIEYPSSGHGWTAPASSSLFRLLDRQCVMSRCRHFVSIWAAFHRQQVFDNPPSPRFSMTCRYLAVGHPNAFSVSDNGGQMPPRLN